MDALIAMGWAVQLKHVPEETSWENHGFVKLKNSAGKVLAESDNIQHNRSIRNRSKNIAELTNLVGKATVEVTDVDATHSPPNDSKEKASCCVM